MARPTDYTTELLEKAKNYLIEWENTPRAERRAIPQVADLAKHLGIARSTVYEWAKTYPEFSDIIEETLATQEGELVDGTLTGRFNSTAGKLMLTKHGYTDKQDITTDGKALPTPILNGVSVHNGNEEDNPTP